MAEAQQSAEPTRGALKTRNVISPIVKDIANLISDSDDQWKELEQVWLELRKLQAGAGGNGGGTDTFEAILFVNGIFMSSVITGTTPEDINE